MKVIFQLGKCVATPNALEVLSANDTEPLEILRRHMTGDWGICNSRNQAENKEALRLGNRILSAYKVGKETVWVITEGDRSVTTILLPEDY